MWTSVQRPDTHPAPWTRRSCASTSLGHSFAERAQQVRICLHTFMPITIDTTWFHGYVDGYIPVSVIYVDILLQVTVEMDTSVLMLTNVRRITEAVRRRPSYSVLILSVHSTVKRVRQVSVQQTKIISSVLEKVNGQKESAAMMVTLEVNMRNICDASKNCRRSPPAGTHRWNRLVWGSRPAQNSTTKKKSSKPNGGGGTWAINSESRPNWAELNYEQDNLFIWSRCYLGKAPLPGEIHSLFSTKLALRETSKKCPEFKHTPPFIWLENDVIVHLHWNAPHKRGGKWSGDVNWLIIAKPCLLSIGEVQLQLQGVRNVMYYFTILVLGVTIICDSVALTSVSDKS